LVGQWTKIDFVHELDALASAIFHNSPAQQVAVAGTQDTCHGLNLTLGQSTKPRQPSLSEPLCVELPPVSTNND
jgi:hypothetical protein